MKSQSITSLVAIAIVLALTGCQQNNKPDSSQPAFARVINTKTIRVGYISYPPSLIKDPNTGNVTGIFHDVLEGVGHRADLKIEWVEEETWGTMIEAVNSGRVDLICTGLWPNSTRAKFADFTDPIYFSPINAYVKAKDRTFDNNLGKVNNPSVKIATVDGEMTSIIAQTDFPKAAVDSLPQITDVSQVLLEVAGGKAAITFVEPAVAQAFLEKNPDSIQQVAGVPPVRVFPNVMMVAKGETKLISLLNTSLNELANTGFIDQAIDQYENTPGLFLRRALPYRLPTQ